VLTIAAALAVSSAMQLLVPRLLAHRPTGARLLPSATVVVLLGHVLMPVLTRLFRGWLHPRR
jgi:uncharacterized protein